MLYNILTSKCIATTTLAMRHYRQQGSTNYHKHIANTNICFALALFQPEMWIWNPWKASIVLKAQNIPKDVVACRFSFFCSISQVLGGSLNRCVVLLLLGPPVCVADRSFGCFSTQYALDCDLFKIYQFLKPLLKHLSIWGGAHRQDLERSAGLYICDAVFDLPISSSCLPRLLILSKCPRIASSVDIELPQCNAAQLYII